MKTVQERLRTIKGHIEKGDVRIMVLGLGSVGNYLLDYLASGLGEDVTIIAVGRNTEKMESDANIVRISALIRKQMRAKIVIEGNVDFTDVGQLTACFEQYRPDFIVNSSRVYTGLKYGSISWKNVRAYGIWAPLAVEYIKNIMEAFEGAGLDGIVINTSYSDAVIPWLRNAAKPYPDFGSGNINHLIPRIQYATADLTGITDYWNMEVMLATGHFHDVVISKEGQTEGVEQLLRIFYHGKEILLEQREIFSRCSIPMPVDAKRNMMNASSNYEIIADIMAALKKNERRRFFSPGAFGETGGYPVMVDGAAPNPLAVIDESVFSLDVMRQKNRESMYLDGIESVEAGILIYTDELLQKVRDRFHVELPKWVSLEDSGAVADLLIREIIHKNQL